MVMLNELKFLVNKTAVIKKNLADKILITYVAKNIDTTPRKVSVLQSALVSQYSTAPEARF